MSTSCARVPPRFGMKRCCLTSTVTCMYGYETCHGDHIRLVVYRYLGSDFNWDEPTLVGQNV